MHRKETGWKAEKERMETFQVFFLTKRTDKTYVTGRILGFLADFNIESQVSLDLPECQMTLCPPRIIVLFLILWHFFPGYLFHRELNCTVYVHVEYGKWTDVIVSAEPNYFYSFLEEEENMLNCTCGNSTSPDCLHIQ